jgi:alkyl hydroperoxide reductase subunit F
MNEAKDAKTVYDLAIIGGGPAGVAAGVYAARKKLSTVFITPNFESQSVVSEEIQNWIGTVALSGQELADNLKKHLLAYANGIVTLREGEYVTKISRVKNSGNSEDFLVETDNGTGKIASYEAKTVLIATGSTRRKLTVPGAAEFENKGLTYCASCDGPLYDGKDVVVVGGGNAGFETAAQLLAYAKSVTLLNRSSTLKADPVTVEKVTAHPNMKLILGAVPKAVSGEKFVSGFTYTDEKTGTDNTLAVQGVFVEIGLIPNTSFATEVLTLNQYGQIPVDPKTQMTNAPGIWAAGDCTDGLYHQNNIAAGDAVKALEDIYLYLRA